MGVAGGCRSHAAQPAGDAAPVAPARRIVSLAPSLSEIVFALGAGGALIGVDDYLDLPEAAQLPRVGGLLNPNLERVLSLRPDLVLMVHSFRSAADRLRDAGLRVAVVPNESLDDLDAAVASVGALTGRETEATALRKSLLDEMRAVAATVAGRPRPRVAFVLDHRPGSLADLYVAGRASFLTRVVELAGGDNVFGDVASGAARIGAEEMLRRAPEVILDSTKGDVAAAWRTLPVLPAVRDGRVLAVFDEKLIVPGPRVARATRRIAALLHPEAFGGK